MRYKTLRHILLISAFVIGIKSYAQYYPVNRYTVEDGLAHSNVFRLFQDKKGFLWIGTEYGLSRFDGNTFVNYTSSEGLSFNTIMSVSETPDETKWISTYGGGICTIKDGIIKPFAIENGPKSIVYTIVHAGGTWMIDKSYELFLYSNKKLSSINIKTPENQKVLFRKMAVYGKSLLFATSDGIYSCDTNFCFIKLAPAQLSGPVPALQPTATGIWAATSSRVLRISDGIVKESVNLPVECKDISDLMVDRQGNIWLIVPDRGIYYICKGIVRNITKELRLRNILINDLFEDRNGSIWIATHGSGLYCLNSLNIINYPVQERRVNNYSTAIAAHGNSLYFGSIGTVAVHKDSVLQPYHIKHLGASEFIYFIHPDSGGNISIGTPWGLINRAPSGSTSHHLKNHGALCRYENADGTSWIGTYNGLLKIDAGNRLLEDYVFMFGTRVNMILSWEQGKLLLATDQGTYVFDCSSHRFVLLHSELRGQYINTLFRDRQMRIWHASSDGLWCTDGAQLRHYTPNDGLSHNRCNTIAEDEDGNIWIGTMGGLNKFDGKQFTEYNHYRGLASNEVLALYFDRDKNLWAGTVNGLSKIKYEERFNNIPLPATYIVSAQDADSLYHFPKHIVLAPGHKSLHLEFTAIDFVYAGRLEFQYCISSNNGERWITTSGRSIDLNALDPGTYTISIRSRIRGGMWSGRPAVLALTVLSPFWLKSWFIILCTIVSMLLFYRVIRWQITRKEKIKKEKAELRDKMLYLKQQALAALINPHFIFNSLNSIQSCIYKNDNLSANRYLVQFGKFIRITLDHAQEAFIGLNIEVERLHLYLKMEQLRFRDKLQYVIVCREITDTSQYHVPNMLLQPFVENAIKHGIVPLKQGGHITIELSLVQQSGELRVIIEDNGIGIDKSRELKQDKNQLYPSMAIKLAEERLRLLSRLNHSRQNFDISVLDLRDEGSSGTRITLTIPQTVLHLNDISTI